MYSKKCKLSCVLLITLSLILSIFPAVASVSSSDTVYVTTPKIQLREQKSLSAKTIGSELPLLSELTVIDQDGEWLQVSFQDITGYVMVYFVSEAYEETTLGQSLVYNVYNATAEQPGSLMIARPLLGYDAYILKAYENGQKLVLLPDLGWQKGFIWPDENSEWYGLLTEDFYRQEITDATVVMTTSVYRQPTFKAVVQGDNLKPMTSISCTQPVGAWAYIPALEGYIPVGAVQYTQVDALHADGKYFISVFSILDPEDGFGTAVAYDNSEVAILTETNDDLKMVILENGMCGYLIETLSESIPGDQESVIVALDNAIRVNQ